MTTLMPSPLRPPVARHPRSRRVSRFLTGIISLCALLMLGVSARAATYTVANTNNTGTGSLRAAITNANANTGTDNIAFSIPASDASYSGGVFTINVTSVLPAISDAVTIDGTTQPNRTDTITGTLGTGGSVGVGGVTLSTVDRSKISIVDANALTVGLDIQANNVTIRGLNIYGFGTTANNNGSANIRIGNNFTGALIEGNIIGTTVTSFSDPGTARSGGDNIRSAGGDSGTIRNNLIGFSAGKGIGLEDASVGWTVTNNEIRGNGIGNSNLDGIDIENSSGTETITGNLILNQEGVGIDSFSGTGGNTITNNTVMGNGRGTGTNVETAGLRIYGSGTTISLNIIRNNYGAGVQIVSSASSNTISRNSIAGNGDVTTLGGSAASGQIGIDLQSASDAVATGTAPYVTLNDAGDGDTGGNGLFNFPVITTATLAAGNLTIEGYAAPGAIIELFGAAPDPRGFGEGQTYLTTLTEGSAADTDTGTGTYSGTINGLSQGTDTTNRFRFTFAAPSGISAGSVLTATATLSNATSEFSGNVTVVAGGTIAGFVYNDANANSTRDTGETAPTTGLYVKLVPSSGSSALAAAAVGTTGAYSFTSVPNGSYNLIFDNNNTLSDITPTYPAGYLGTEAATGIRSVTVASNSLADQNFGLFNGTRVAGRVFLDNGTGSGTANNGVADGGETGQAGLTVNATNAAGTTTYATATTDTNGNYTLYIPASVGAGTAVQVRPVLPAGNISTGGSAGTTGGTYTRATPSVGFTFAVGNSYTGVNFGDVAPNTFTNDGAKTGIAGNSVYYPHVYTANSAGSISFATTNAPNPATVTGWTQAVFLDTNGNGQLDTGETQITAPITLAAGQSIAILVRDTIPANAPAGAKDVVTVTANFTYANASPALTSALTRTDTTTSAASGLELVKAVSQTSAKRGDVLTYTVTYRNISAEALSNLQITDTIPAFTTFLSAAYGTTPTGLTNGTITAPTAGQAGTVTWKFTGSLAANATGPVTLRITVQ